MWIEIGFFCVALAVLELILSVDRAGLELTEMQLPLPPGAGVEGVCHHRLAWEIAFC